MSFSDFKEISAGEFISITGGILAGLLLAYLEEDLLMIPGLLVLIPGFLEMRNSITGSLSSRLSSALHIGHIRPRFENTSFLRENMLAVFTLTIMTSIVLGLVSLLATYVYFKVFYIKLLFISLIAAATGDIIVIPLTVWTCFWLFRHGHDPNNIMGPYITTIGDIISLISLFAVMVIL